MANKILVVEIEQTTTRVLEMNYAVQHPVVHSFFTFPTPLDTVRDGAVRLNEDFVMRFKNEYAFHHMSAKTVIFLLTTGRISSRDAVIPYVPENQIQGMIDSIINDYFPVDPTLYHLNYRIIKKTKTETTKEIELNLLAIPNDLTAGYFELATALGLQVENITFIGQASTNLCTLVNGGSVYESQIMHELKPILSKLSFLDKFKKEKKADAPKEEGESDNNLSDDGAVILGGDDLEGQSPVSAIVKIETFSSYLTIVKDGVPVMQRNIQMGIGDALEYVKNVASYGDAIQDHEALEVLYKTNLLNSTLRFDSYSSDENAALKEEITNSIRSLISSVSRALDYYVSRNQDTYINQIVLTGAGAGIMGLSRLFQNELTFDTIVINEFPHLKFGDNVEKEATKVDEVGDEEGKSLDEEISSIIAGRQTDISAIDSTTGEHVSEKAELAVEREAEKFNPHAFALLIAAGLSYDGIVTDAERVGDSNMAKALKDKKITIACIVGSAIILLVALFLVLGSLFKYSNNVRKKHKLEKAIAYYEELDVEGVFNRYQSQKKKTEEIKNVLAYTHSPAEYLVDFIEELEKIMPSKTYIISIVATDTGVTLEFQSPDKASAAKVLVSMRAMKSANMVSSQSLSDSDSYLARDPDNRAVSYTVDFVYNECIYDVDAFLNGQVQPGFTEPVPEEDAKEAKK